MARAYLRTFPEKLREEVAVRFDVVSVYLLPSEVEFDLFRGAFGW
jgi:putative endonuclease